MKIILVTDYFYPQSNGGTEKYVYLLAKHLSTSYNVKILSIHAKLNEQKYDDLEINYILPNSNTKKDVIQGLLPSSNFEQFKIYINNEQPNVVHFHTLTTNFNHFHIDFCFNANIKTYFTSHIPGDLCPRGDFMYKGKVVCDGTIEKRKCLKCLTTKEDNHLKKYINYFYYSLNKTNPIDIRLTHLEEIYKHTDKIIVVCNWQKDFFIKNGVSANHIEICRQAPENVKVQKTIAKKIRLGFLGRITKVKGLHLLLHALDKFDHNEFSLSIAAITPSVTENNYLEELQKQSKNMKNCRWIFNIPSSQLSSFFENIDFLVVPSLWLETGPFVIYEALASGTPVLTTNFGGQSELINPGVNGFLFDPNVLSLTRVLESLKDNVKISSIKSLRKVEEIAQEMAIIYNKS